MKKILLLLCLHCILHAEDHAPRTISSIGTIHPKYATTLGSLVSGRVENVLADVGDVVSEGQPLLILDASLFTIDVADAQAALQAATVELEDAERNFIRMQKLYDKPEGIRPSISQKRFEDAATRFDQAKAAKTRAQEALNRCVNRLNETVIKAPYKGVITKRFVHPGEPITASPATKLLEIMFIDTEYLEFSIPQNHLTNVRPGMPIHMKIDGIHEEQATIASIFPEIDATNRSVKCRAVLENRDHHIPPGALVHIHIMLEDKEDVAL